MCNAIHLLFVAISLTSPTTDAKPNNDRSLINHWFLGDTSSSNIPDTPFSTRLGIVDQRQSQTSEDDEGGGGLCSCSPRAYDFRLNFNAGCDDTLADNVGVDDSICFFTKGGNPEDYTTGNIVFPRIAGREPDEAYRLFHPIGGGGRRKRGLRRADDANLSSSIKWESLLEQIPFSSHYKHAASIRRQRLTQDYDPKPTVITSVTFLEFNYNVDMIIHQNSTYFNTVLADGDVISYLSISSALDSTKALSDQLDLLPGGVMLVLFGINKDNIMVQNTVAWGYKLTECGVDSLDTGDAIGWISLENYAPSRAAFCPAMTDMPTGSPTGSPNTLSPSTSPAAAEIISPTANPVAEVVQTMSPIANIVPIETMAPTKQPTSTPAVAPPDGSKSAKQTSAKSSKYDSDSPPEEQLAKSSKVFTKAAKLFKTKSEKISGMIEGDGSSSTITNVVDAGTVVDTKAGKLSSKASSAKSSKAVPQDTKSSKLDTKANVGMIQVSRPQVPTKPPVSSVPIASPVTTLPPATAANATPNPTSATSQLSQEVLSSMLASPTEQTEGTNATFPTAQLESDNISKLPVDATSQAEDV